MAAAATATPAKLAHDSLQSEESGAKLPSLLQSRVERSEKSAVRLPSLEELVVLIRKAEPSILKDRYAGLFRRVPKATTARDLVHWMGHQPWCHGEDHARNIGQALFDAGLMWGAVGNSSTFSTKESDLDKILQITHAFTIRDMDCMIDRLECSRKGLKVGDRHFRGQTFQRCFFAYELVDYLVSEGIAGSKEEAAEAGRQLCAKHVMHRADKDPLQRKKGQPFGFDAGRYPYRLSRDEMKLLGFDVSSISHSFVLSTADRIHEDLAKDGQGFFGRECCEWLEREGAGRTQEECQMLVEYFISAWIIRNIGEDQRARFSADKGCAFLRDLVHAKLVNKVVLPKKDLKQKERPLGVVRLDYGYPPIPGDIDHPNSFDFPVVYRKVPGLLFEVAQGGKLTPEVEAGMTKAVRDLEALGAWGITGDCGFMANYQGFVRGIANVPVFMSSLSLLPLISQSLGPKDSILVTTANSDSLKALFPKVWNRPEPSPEAFEVSNDFLRKQCGVAMVSPEQVLVHGFQDVPGFEVVAEATSLLSAKVDVSVVTKGIVKDVQSILQQRPDVKFILQECTELPHFTVALRKATGLPVMDALTAPEIFCHTMRFDAQATSKRGACLGHHCQLTFPDTPAA